MTIVRIAVHDEIVVSTALEHDKVTVWGAGQEVESSEKVVDVLVSVVVVNLAATTPAPKTKRLTRFCIFAGMKISRLRKILQIICEMGQLVLLIWI